MKKYIKYPTFMALAFTLSLTTLSGCIPGDKNYSSGSYLTVTKPYMLQNEESMIKVTIRNDSFAEDIASHPDTVSVNYGVGTVEASRIERDNNNTLSVYFQPEKNSDYVRETWKSNPGGYICVSPEGTKSKSSASGRITVDYPYATVEQPAPKDAETLSIVVDVHSADVNNDISPNDISLGEAFENMTVTGVSKQNDNSLIVDIAGDMTDINEQNIPYTEGSIILNANTTTAGISICAETELTTPSAYWGDYPHLTQDGRHFRLNVSLENCIFSDSVQLDEFKLTGDSQGLALTSLDRVDDTTVELTLGTTGEPIADDMDTLSILIDSKATTANQTLGVDFDMGTEGIYGDVTDVSKNGDNAEVSVVLTADGYTFDASTSKKDIIPSDTFENASVTNVEFITDTQLNVKLSVPISDIKLNHMNAGALTISDSRLNKVTYGDPEPYYNVVLVPLYTDESLNIIMNSTTSDSSIATGKFLTATNSDTLSNSFIDDNFNSLSESNGIVHFDLGMSVFKNVLLNPLCNYAVGKLPSVARAPGMWILKKGILPLLGLDLFGEKDVVAEKLEEVMEKLNTISTQINELDDSIKTLINSVDSEAYKQQMRDVQSTVLKLKPQLAGFQGGLSALNKLEPGTEKYNHELSVLASSVNNAQGIDFHGVTYALGEKILTDAAGTSSGALESHYKRTMAQNNWEQQTYDERERFYLYTVGTYYQSVLFSKIAIQYTLETTTSDVERGMAEGRLRELDSQIEKVKTVAEKYAIHRLDPQVDRHTKTGIVVDKNMTTVTYNEKNMFEFVTREEAYNLIKQRYLDKKIDTLNYSDSFTLPIREEDKKESKRMITEQEAAELMKYSDKPSLMEEFRSAGLTQGNSDKILLRDIYVAKSLLRTGSSPTQYVYNIFYKTFTNKAENTLFYNLHTLAGTDKVENVILKPNEIFWQSNYRGNPVTATKVYLRDYSDDLYIS